MGLVQEAEPHLMVSEPGRGRQDGMPGTARRKPQVTGSLCGCRPCSGLGAMRGSLTKEMVAPKGVLGWGMTYWCGKKRGGGQA